MRTRDGGRHWQSLNLPASAQRPADQTQIFTGQGFDSCTAPSVAQMQSWFASSPYRIWNLYMGGSSLYKGCTPLSLSFISPLAQQGWKFIPTWVGLQAPCTSYPSRFSADPSTAYAQGVSEADAALDRAASLGLARADQRGIIIYFDLEYFNPNDTACREVAKSFVSGWSGQLRARGNKAGLYGHFRVMSDYAQIGNVPDHVWIAQWQTPYAYDSSASVFGIPYVSDTLWANQQRLHQYTGGHNETWGGVTLNIDSDVLDGAVATLPCYSLSVNTLTAGGAAAILTSPNCGGSFIAGTNVPVQANPNEGYLFSGWSGSATGFDNPLTLVLDGDKSLSASFARIQSRVFIPLVRR